MNLLAKLGMGERTRRNFVAILLVAAGGSIIYGLPYFHYDYYEPTRRPTTSPTRRSACSAASSACSA